MVHDLMFRCSLNHSHITIRNASVVGHSDIYAHIYPMQTLPHSTDPQQSDFASTQYHNGEEQPDNLIMVVVDHIQLICGLRSVLLQLLHD